mgnify:CR=1 FL=1
MCATACTKRRRKLSVCISFGPRYVTPLKELSIHSFGLSTHKLRKERLYYVKYMIFYNLHMFISPLLTKELKMVRVKAIKHRWRVLKWWAIQQVATLETHIGCNFSRSQQRLKLWRFFDKRTGPGNIWTVMDIMACFVRWHPSLTLDCCNESFIYWERWGVFWEPHHCVVVKETIKLQEYEKIYMEKDSNIQKSPLLTGVVHPHLKIQEVWGPTKMPLTFLLHRKYLSVVLYFFITHRAKILLRSAHDSIFWIYFYRKFFRTPSPPLLGRPPAPPPPPFAPQPIFTNNKQTNKSTENNKEVFFVDELEEGWKCQRE